LFDVIVRNKYLSKDGYSLEIAEECERCLDKYYLLLNIYGDHKKEDLDYQFLQIGCFRERDVKSLLRRNFRDVVIRSNDGCAVFIYSNYERSSVIFHDFSCEKQSNYDNSLDRDKFLYNDGRYINEFNEIMDENWEKEYTNINGRIPMVPMGRWLTAIMGAKSLSVEDVAAKSGLDAAIINGLLQESLEISLTQAEAIGRATESVPHFVDMWRSNERKKARGVPIAPRPA
jgi:hypothetical protein